MNFRKIKKFTFALTLALGVAGAFGLSSLPTIQAQAPPRPQDRDRERIQPQRVPVIMERMERNAFREGVRSGVLDARRGLRPNLWRHQGYRLGNSLQRRDFRMGYWRGFRRG